MKKKNILLISISAGSGHKRAAEAINLYAKNNFKNEINVKHVDLMDYTSLPMKKGILDSYDLLIKKFPEIWAILYKKTNSPKVTSILNRLTKEIKLLQIKKLLTFIKEFKPDQIISTHFIASDILLRYKPVSNNIPISTVITDYEAHALWVSEKTNHYFVASEKVKKELIKIFSVPKEKITVSGIPVDPIFYKKKNLESLQKKYNINSKHPTILVLSGGQGLGKSDKILEILLKIKTKLQIFIIAGKNKKLEKKLQNTSIPDNIKLKIIGWTNCIDEYMRIADVIVSKPGGMTTTECLTLKKPIIAANPIPGQEEANAKFIKETKTGFYIKQNKELLEIIKNKKYLKTKKIAPKQSAKIIINKILNN